MRWYQRFFRRGLTEKQLDSELRFHIEQKVADLVAAGIAPEEARRHARLEFGGLEQVKEECRDVGAAHFLETLIQDLRFGLRMVVRNPRFSLTVILILGLAIALNVGIFSAVSGILLQEPPVKSPERVLMISLANKKGGDGNPASAPEFFALRNQSTVFEDMAASAYDAPVLTGRGEPESVARAQVTPNLFQLLGVPALFGYTFSSGEDVGKQEFNAVISYDLWQHKFAADPNVVGKSIVLAKQTYTVIGVMPADAKYAIGPCAVWIPIAIDRALRPMDLHNRDLVIVARLRKGVGVRQAQTQVGMVLSRLAENDPDEKDWTARVVRLREALVNRDTQTPIKVLMGVVVFVLLIACANVSGIFLARSATRQNEFAVRAALGAGRWRLVRQMLGESLGLALLSGGLGLVLGLWCMHLLRAKLGSNPELAWLAGKIAVDGRVLVFAVIVSVLTMLLSGFLPALRSSKPDLHAALKEGGTASVGIRPNRMRSAFVIGQFALVTVLVAATLASIQILIAEMRTQLGFDFTQMLNVDMSLSGSKYTDPTRQAAFFGETIERIQSLPGVDIAGATNPLPESAAPRLAFEAEDQLNSKPEERRVARNYRVSPDYFRAMRIPVLAGRSFALSDRSGAQEVVIINQTLSKQVFRDTDPVGRYIRTYASPTSLPDTHQIVGVVGDVVDYVGQTKKEPEIYMPFLQKPSNEMSLVIRATFDPLLIVSAVRSSIWAVDEDVPIGKVRTMKEVFEGKGAGDRLLGSLLGGFTSLALVFAAIGVYGAVSYMVTQRTREIGVRLALGAQRKDLFGLIVGRGMLLAGIGAGLGLVGAFAITHILTTADSEAWLHRSLVLAIAPTVVLTAAMLASCLPARRAAKVDPMVALRYE